MISITDKHNCCGCSACTQRCPTQCISMKEDEEGFLYPQVDKETCVDCHLCEKVCPVLHPDLERKPLLIFAVKNPDEDMRMQSSSGGVFTSLSKSVLSDGGVVFGARFDSNWEVEHCDVQHENDLDSLRRSKYVQSRIGATYAEAKKYLKEGRKVLYTGTPCQIAGLRLFLNNDYDNLLTADVACHGVPSPMVWRHYLQYKIDEAQSSRRNKVLNIREISFRDKSTGWRGYSLMLKFSDNNDSDIVVKESVGKNLFMQGFLKDLYLRPSCYNCPFKSGRSGSDLTLADFWGINKHMPELDDNGGVSLVFINTQKGRIFYESLLLENHTATYEQAVSGNPVLVRPVKEPLQRIDFWKRYSSEKTKAIRKIVCEMQPSFLLKCLGKIKRTLKR